MKIRSDGTIVFVVIVIIIFSVINYSFSEKSYKEGYVQGYGDCFYGNKKSLISANILTKNIIMNKIKIAPHHRDDFSRRTLLRSTIKKGMFIEQIYYSISFFKCQINTERVCYIWA